MQLQLNNHSKNGILQRNHKDTQVYLILDGTHCLVFAT